MLGELAEGLTAFVAILALFVNMYQFKKAREVDRNEIQKNAAYCVNAWIEVKEGKEEGKEEGKKKKKIDFYNLYICNNSSGPIRNVKIDLMWDGDKLSAPTKNTYPIIPVGNFVTTFSKEGGWFTFLERIDTVQEYRPICIETHTDKYKVLKLEFMDTFSIKWIRNYDLNQGETKDLIQINKQKEHRLIINLDGVLILIKAALTCTRRSPYQRQRRSRPCQSSL